jgi:hypothetical protein
MSNRGKCKSILLFLFFLAKWNSLAFSQNNYYYVCAYDSNELRSNIRVSKINLDSKAIIDKSVVPIYGWLSFRVPLTIGTRNRHFLVVIADDGVPGKNSTSLDTIVSNYAILDSNLETLRIGHLQNINFITGSGYPLNNLQRLEYRVGLGNNEIEYTGRLSLGVDRSIGFVDSIRYIYQEADYPIINRFQHLKRSLLIII